MKLFMILRIVKAQFKERLKNKKDIIQIKMLWLKFSTAMWHLLKLLASKKNFRSGHTHTHGGEYRS